MEKSEYMEYLEVRLLEMEYMGKLEYSKEMLYILVFEDAWYGMLDGIWISKHIEIEGLFL